MQRLKELPPWEWPDDAPERLLAALRDRRTAATDRMIAAELAGDMTVIDEELAAALLSVVADGEEAADLRSVAAISLGPVLETADIYGFPEDDPSGFIDVDDVPIDRRTFEKIQETLRRVYLDGGAPELARRMALEGSARAPQAWHRSAIGSAYASGEPAWMLSAVFCMGYVAGFDGQILEALGSAAPVIHREAVVAAGRVGLDEAWSHVAELVRSEEIDKDLRLAAIGALAAIRPREAVEILEDLVDHRDEEIAGAAQEALEEAMIPLLVDDEELE